MEDQQALSDLEIVGIAVAAAAALGGLVIGLSRGQERATDDSLETKALAVPSGELLTERARRGLERVQEQYPQLREVTRDPLARTLNVIQHVEPGKRRRSSFRSKSRTQEAASTAAPYLSAGVAKVLESVSSALQRFSVDPDQVRESAREQVRGRGSRVLRQFEEEVAPAARERSEEIIERARETLEDVRSRKSDPRGRLETVADRGQSAASSVARSSGNAAKETVATVLWLSIASALVYLLLLSPERREQVKRAACGAYEQARLLALDFRGYEPEM